MDKEANKKEYVSTVIFALDIKREKRKEEGDRLGKMEKEGRNLRAKRAKESAWRASPTAPRIVDSRSPRPSVTQRMGFSSSKAVEPARATTARQMKKKKTTAIETRATPAISPPPFISQLPIRRRMWEGEGGGICGNKKVARGKENTI